jgi:tetratricopeptide (TPR) repeat protein
MVLTYCKECKQEVSTEARTCPHCGIEYPGVVENNHRLVGFVALALLLILGIYIYNLFERVDNPVVKNTGQIVNKGQDQVKIVSENKPVTNAPEQSELIAAPLAEPSVVTEQPTEPEKTQSAVTQAPSKQDVHETPDKSETIPSAQTPVMMVMRLLDYATQNGGLKHEAEIQQTKLLLDSVPRPETGNKKAAKQLNAKGLALSNQGDFNNAVKLFAEANKLDPSDVEIVNNLGFLYIKQGNLKSALETVTIALTLSPGRATAWENLGEIFGLKGDLNKAVASFSNAYRFSKDRMKMHQYMKKLNEKEQGKTLKQARAKAMEWAEKAYLEDSKMTTSKP